MAFLKKTSSSTSLLFGIVTYKEKYWECNSYCSLISSFKLYRRDEVLNIFIFDNTDIDEWNLETKDLGNEINVIYVNYRNPGISVAYNIINDFAFKNSFKWVVYLDQDTLLPPEAYLIYSEKSIEDNQLLPLKAPIIYSNGKIMSPCLYKNYRSYAVHKFNENTLQFEEYSCINSGLMISCDYFVQVGGYNTRLKIDFCDHDFIEKSKSYLKKIDLIDLKLHQNFSANTHTKTQALSRYKIFCKDMKQFCVNRNSFIIHVFVDLPHLIKLTFTFKTFDFIKIRITN